MNIFLHELKSYWKTTLLWIVVLVLLMAFFMSLFPTVAASADQFRDVIANLPASAQKALGLSLSSLTSLQGFYAYLLPYIMLCGAIQAMNLGLSVISKEASQKTADFLLTKPISREQAVTAKLLATLVMVVITNAIFLPASLLMAKIVATEPYDQRTIALLAGALFLVQLIFLVLGALLGVVIPKVKSVGATSLSVVFGFFVLSLFGSVIGEKAVRYLTPFQFYVSASVAQTGSYEGQFLLYEAVLLVAALIASYMIYARRDVHSV